MRLDVTGERTVGEKLALADLAGEVLRRLVVHQLVLVQALFGGEALVALAAAVRLLTTAKDLAAGDDVRGGGGRRARGEAIFRRI